MNDQAQAVGDDAVLAQLEGYLEAEEATPEPEEEELEASPEETEESEEESGEADEETEAPEEEVLELNWNGELKAFKKSEVVELAQKGYDYTNKTQQLADQRRNLEAQQQQFQQQIAIQSALADKVAAIKSLDNQLEAYKQVNWQELAQQDPMQYLTLNQTYQQLKDQRNEAVAEYSQGANQLTEAQQIRQAEMLERESRLLADAIPEFRGEKAAQTKSELANFLQTYGYTVDEIGSVLDHRAIRVAFDAMKYANLQKSKPQITKRIAEAPAVVKGKKVAQTNEVQQLRERARKGDEKAALKLLEKSL